MQSNDKNEILLVVLVFLSLALFETQMAHAGTSSSKIRDFQGISPTKNDWLLDAERLAYKRMLLKQREKDLKEQIKWYKKRTDECSGQLHEQMGPSEPRNSPRTNVRFSWCCCCPLIDRKPPVLGYPQRRLKHFQMCIEARQKAFKELGEQLHGYSGKGTNFALESPRSQPPTPSGSIESELDLPFGSSSGHEGLVSTYPPGPSQRDKRAPLSPRVRKPLFETKDF